MAKAYQVLRQRGIVETAGRNGTRVRPRPPVTPMRAAAVLPAPPGALDLSLGLPDARLLPAVGPCLRRLAEADAAPAAGYHEAGPIPSWSRWRATGWPRTACRWTGAHCHRGALDGIERLLTAHLRPGDRVAVEDPGWSNLIDLIAALGMEPVALPVDDDGPLWTVCAAGWPRAPARSSSPRGRRTRPGRR